MGVQNIEYSVKLTRREVRPDTGTFAAPISTETKITMSFFVLGYFVSHNFGSKKIKPHSFFPKFGGSIFHRLQNGRRLLTPGPAANPPIARPV